MSCPQCKTSNADKARFCSECGAELGSETTLQSSAPAQQSTVANVATDSLPNSTIAGKYRIDTKLGAGGMGAVYRATRLLIGDEVAVKILHSEQNDPRASERFRREAQAAARLKHPNAVTIYDFGVTDDGLQYLVMELVEGESLRQIMKKQGTLTPTVCAWIIGQVCAALDEAHRHNIIHRDIKPDNLIVNETTSGSRVKVLDFGIAKLRDDAAGNLTETGSILGIPHYMSPEQCLGEELDGRSDIYSLGVVLYEMLCGVVPFHSAVPSAVVVQHVNQPPPSLRSKDPSISLAVDRVVLRTLAKQRDARPQSAAILGRELACALRESEPSMDSTDKATIEGADATINAQKAHGNSSTMPPTLRVAAPYNKRARSANNMSSLGSTATRKSKADFLRLAIAAPALFIVMSTGIYLLLSGSDLASDLRLLISHGNSSLTVLATVLLLALGGLGVRMLFSTSSELSRMLGSVRKRLWLVAGVTTLITSLTALYLASKPNIYEASATLRVRSEQKQLQKITPDFLLRAINESDVQELSKQSTLLVEAAQDNLHLEPIEKTDLIKVRFQYPDPQLVARFVSLIADTLVRSNLEQGGTSSTARNYEPGLSIAQYARIPTAPVGPHRLQGIIIALFLSLALSMSLVLFLETDFTDSAHGSSRATIMGRAAKSPSSVSPHARIYIQGFRALVSLLIGLILLFLVRFHWIWFLWPLGALALAVIFFGIMMAHSAMRMVRESFDEHHPLRRYPLAQEAAFWSIVCGGGYGVYLILTAV